MPGCAVIQPRVSQKSWRLCSPAQCDKHLVRKRGAFLMVDLWYTFGALVADSNFLKSISKTPPTFNRVNWTITAGNVNMVNPAAGEMTSDINTFRVAIATYIHANFAAPIPVISLYTAAKMAQLIITDMKILSGALSQANQIFTSYGGSKASSAQLLTLTGACLLDIV